MNKQFHFCQRILPNTDLIAGGFLDSMSFKVLAAYLEEQFHITLTGDDMTEAHFRTPETIAQLVQQKTTRHCCCFISVLFYFINS